ncbi:putative laccase-9 [Vitis vinifera]|uniref:laccase n=1 Tax=Vitis vinifera TaxID=29760 RepID=A0A438GK39_VITVI|nr:putative laccase-9 [Vitis vinifera]
MIFREQYGSHFPPYDPHGVFGYPGVIESFMHAFNFLLVKEASYTRLCSTKNILTVNGQFPGPTIYAKKGETIIVDVYNRGKENITIHWHGVNMPRYPWTDGPEYITQCPIQPGSKFSQKIILSSEEGTLWWHAHSDWTRATVHGAIIVYPKNGTKYPFPKPNAEIPIILGQWWKSDVNAVRDEGLATGADPNASDSLLINGQPGDLYPCSKSVDHGKTYLLRIINAALHEALFFSIAKHKMTVVGTDGSYTKPLTRDYITIYPGQTFDVLLEANQLPDHYYMAAKTYSIAPVAQNFYDNTTTTAIVQYRGYYTPSSPLSLPHFPAYNDTNASVQGPMGRDSPQRSTTSVRFYQLIIFPLEYQTPEIGTEVRVLEYNSTVEIVFQGTNLVAGTHHPMHLHGYSFYLVGWGFGNFDKIGTLCAIIWWILPFRVPSPFLRMVGCNQIRGIQPWSVVHALPCRTPCDLGHGNCVHSEKW